MSKIISHSKRRETCKSSRDRRSVQGTHSASERIRTEHQDVRGPPKNGQMKQPEERQAALSRLSDVEFHTRFLAAKESDTS